MRGLPLLTFRHVKPSAIFADHKAGINKYTCAHSLTENVLKPTGYRRC